MEKIPHAFILLLKYFPFPKDSLDSLWRASFQDFFSTQCINFVFLHVIIIFTSMCDTHFPLYDGSKYKCRNYTLRQIKRNKPSQVLNQPVIIPTYPLLYPRVPPVLFHITQVEVWGWGSFNSMNFPNVSQLQEHLCFITFCWSTVKIHSVFSNQTINMLCLLQRVDWDDGFSSSLKKNKTKQPKPKTQQTKNW